MKKLGYRIALFIGGLLLSYLSFSYVIGDPNPFHYSTENRLIQVFLFLCIQAFGNIIINFD